MFLRRTRFVLQRLTNVVCSSNDEKKHMKKKFINCEQSTYQSCSFFLFLKFSISFIQPVVVKCHLFGLMNLKKNPIGWVQEKNNACVPQKRVKTLNHVYGPYAPCSKYAKRSEHDEHSLQAYGNVPSKFLVNFYRQYSSFYWLTWCYFN